MLPQRGEVVGRAKGQGKAGAYERCGRELEILKAGLDEFETGSHRGGNVGACVEKLCGLGVTVDCQYSKALPQEFGGVAALAAAEVDGEWKFGRFGVWTALGKLIECPGERFAWAFVGDGLKIARPVTMLCVDVGGFEHG